MPNYNSIPEPIADTESLRQSVLALKQAVESLTGQRGGNNVQAATSADLSTFSTSTAASIAAVQESVDTLSTTVAGLTIPSLTQTEFVSGLIAVPTNTDYRIVVNMPHGGTITETTTRCTSGTATATFRINATALGGTANSVSSTEQVQTHTSANVVVAGDDLVITVTANASCLNMSFTIRYTRTLA